MQSLIRPWLEVGKRMKAVKKGLENEQIAIYDLDRKEVVYL